jgi:hypothetical protein
MSGLNFDASREWSGESADASENRRRMLVESDAGEISAERLVPDGSALGQCNWGLASGTGARRRKRSTPRAARVGATAGHRLQTDQKRECRVIPGEPLLLVPHWQRDLHRDVLHARELQPERLRDAEFHEGRDPRSDRQGEDGSRIEDRSCSNRTCYPDGPPFTGSVGPRRRACREKGITGRGANADAPLGAGHRGQLHGLRGSKSQRDEDPSPPSVRARGARGGRPAPRRRSPARRPRPKRGGRG